MVDAYWTAAVCRRGHVENWGIDVQEMAWPEPRSNVPKRCPICGAEILTACPSCGHRLRGFSREYGGSSSEPQDFCDGCGSPMPWASRQARLWELENRLVDEPNLAEADRLTISEQLEALRQPDLDEEEQVRRWQRVKRLAPTAFATVQSIFVSVASAYVQQKLGV